jgi:F-type H+-transporting ATPase subunit c
MELTALAQGIGLLAIIGAGIGIGLIGYGATTAIGRNPEAFGKIFTVTMLALAFAEILGIFAFLGIFLIK